MKQNKNTVYLVATIDEILADNALYGVDVVLGMPCVPDSVQLVTPAEKAALQPFAMLDDSGRTQVYRATFHGLFPE